MLLILFWLRFSISSRVLSNSKSAYETDVINDVSDENAKSVGATVRVGPLLCGMNQTGAHHLYASRSISRIAFP